MDDWLLDEEWEWEDEEEYQDLLYEWTEDLADLFFVSDNEYLPSAGEDYDLGRLDPEAWWPLVNQLDEIVDLETVMDLLLTLDRLLRLDGLPTELLEAPLDFLESALEGNLPPAPSGRRVGSRRLIKIALAMIQLLQEFPEAAQAAVRAWADVHRQLARSLGLDGLDEMDLSDLLFAPDMPPAMIGFSMIIALTLIRWPMRAEGLPLPPGFADPEVYGEILARWKALPDSPTVREEGASEAEALFAQGHLAHTLAQMGSMELVAPEEMDEEEMALAYSRLSRAILWVHNQCRHCPEREGVACKVAAHWPEQPTAILDVASEIANTGKIEGCVRMADGE